MEYDRNKMRAIWSGYKKRVELQHTVRIGFARCGIYPMMDRYPDDRPESVAEHTSNLTTLAIETSVHFPGLLPASKLGRALVLANYHDSAESIIGDIADNGARDEDDKDRREYDALNDQILDKWPTKERKALLRDFHDFQNRATLLSQLMFVLDKTECAMRALCYEQAGHPGSVLNDPHMSDLDRFYADRVGSGSTADAWGYHALERTAGLGRVYFDFAYALLTTAFEDVRGEVPAWLPQRYRELTSRD